MFIKTLDEIKKNYTPNIPKYIIFKGDVLSFFFTFVATPLLFTKLL
jgi:hypothetical protein